MVREGGSCHVTSPATSAPSCVGRMRHRTIRMGSGSWSDHPIRTDAGQSGHAPARPFPERRQERHPRTMSAYGHRPGMALTTSAVRSYALAPSGPSPRTPASRVSAYSRSDARRPTPSAGWRRIRSGTTLPRYQRPLRDAHQDIYTVADNADQDDAHDHDVRELKL